MKKKVLTIVLVLALAITAVIGVTLAYFTDTDQAENVFTVGEVKIDLHEANNEDPPKIDAAYHEWLADQTLIPGDKVTNTIAKRVYVENTGKSDAYVRVHLAVPSILDNAWPDWDPSKNILHYNAARSVLKAGQWNWGTKIDPEREEGSLKAANDAYNAYQTTIDGIEYNVYVITYETALKEREVTSEAINQVYIYKDVTKEIVDEVNKTLNGKWNMLIFAEAGQVNGNAGTVAHPDHFENAFDALNTQFGDPMASTYEQSPWGTAVVHP